MPLKPKSRRISHPAEGKEIRKPEKVKEKATALQKAIPYSASRAPRAQANTERPKGKKIGKKAQKADAVPKEYTRTSVGNASRWSRKNVAPEMRPNAHTKAKHNCSRIDEERVRKNFIRRNAWKTKSIVHLNTKSIHSIGEKPGNGSFPIHAYYTPFFEENQAFLAKTRIFVDYDNIFFCLRK